MLLLPLPQGYRVVRFVPPLNPTLQRLLAESIALTNNGPREAPAFLKSVAVKSLASHGSVCGKQKRKGRGDAGLVAVGEAQREEIAARGRFEERVHQESASRARMVAADVAWSVT